MWVEKSLVPKLMPYIGLSDLVSDEYEEWYRLAVAKKGPLKNPSREIATASAMMFGILYN